MVQRAPREVFFEVALNLPVMDENDFVLKPNGDLGHIFGNLHHWMYVSCRKKRHMPVPHVPILEMFDIKWLATSKLKLIMINPDMCKSASH